MLNSGRVGIIEKCLIYNFLSTQRIANGLYNYTMVYVAMTELEEL